MGAISSKVMANMSCKYKREPFGGSQRFEYYEQCEAD